MRRQLEAAKAALAQVEGDDDVASESDLNAEDEELLEEGEDGISDDSADLMQGVAHHDEGGFSEVDEDDPDGEQEEEEVDEEEEDAEMQQTMPASLPSARRPPAASGDAADLRDQQELLQPGVGQHSLDAALLQLQVCCCCWIGITSDVFYVIAC
jgi:hypothetical protein